MIYLLAQSGDPTCNGLTTVSEGSPTIKLTKGKCADETKLSLSFLISVNIFEIRFLLVLCRQLTRSTVDANIQPG
jgi:hypothetical protein